jgi:hypothetical protein
VEKVSQANKDILLGLPQSQEKIVKLSKSECVAIVQKLEIETGQKCEDIDKEARLKLLFELQELVQGVVEKLVGILEVHERLVSHVDRLMTPHMTPQMSQTSHKTEESD